MALAVILLLSTIEAFTFAGNVNFPPKISEGKELRLPVVSTPIQRQINLSEYKAKGRYITINKIKVNGNITVYESGDFSSKRVLILIHDLFGIDPHFQYIADKLSENATNFSVIIPDFFNGDPYQKKNWPPRNSQFVTNFINRRGSWTRTAKNDLRTVFMHYNSKYSIENFGVFGYCWGGKMAANAASDPEFTPKCSENICNGSINVRAIGLIHPSLLKTADANKINRPTIVMPSKDEINMIPFCNRIKNLQGSDSCFHKRYTDMSHGFSGALSNWSKPNVFRRMTESLQLLESFFRIHMNI